MNLLCRVGLHHQVWQPAWLGSRPDLGWLQIRRCTRCGQTVSRR